MINLPPDNRYYSTAAFLLRAKAAHEIDVIPARQKNVYIKEHAPGSSDEKIRNRT
jgi:hypothetical protein